ncbi:MAG: alanine--tRNA ligase [Clostridiales bacterium]|jgi:alanyl-tRNA synthetase|nr:alanine--tRNA ligase [Clostridiales bacterium]
MEYIGLNEIREKFLKFFEDKAHYRMKSFSLVPQNDNSLLLINSGMAPLKPYFTGREKPPSKRVATCQKCIRTIDIDRVGLTLRHGTFFEMLGNFSFGDYFKEEIIPWAWEFMTQVMKIPENLLYPSVYEKDDEAFDIWHKKVGLPKEKITRLGKDDNFWEVGLGPCGPSSEIYYDRGEKYGCGKETCGVGCDCDRFVEVWNLVFTQFDKKEDGSYERLKFPNIDTGMGLERIAMVMQNVDAIFDVDTVKAIRDEVCRYAGVTYGENPQTDISIRIITDHIRSVTFMTADGVLPSNEGTGYVLRRLLRRAAMRGKLLGINSLFLAELSKTAIDLSKEAYPELSEKRDYIYRAISVEETRFNQTLDQGMELLKSIKAELIKNSEKVMRGEDVFKLYDTFGFPVELTREILASDGISADEDGFAAEMKKQKQRARQAREESTYMGSDATVFNSLSGVAETKFVGYGELQVKDAKILAIICENEVVASVGAGQEVSVILDKTPLYAESGGQMGDRGKISGEGFEIEISDCVKVAGNRTAHIGKVTNGTAATGSGAAAYVDIPNRMATAANHTSTHLLQKALREVLGSHVEQSGSQVSANRLRFDFTHFAPLTDEEIEKVENIVTEKIFEALPVEVSEMPVDEARKMGATALFGEKYGDIVRVVKIGGFSTELCGGTHLTNTYQAKLFKILSESGISAGVRRIEAVTGENALLYYKNQDARVKTCGKLLKTTPENIAARIEALTGNIKSLTQEIEKLRSAASGNIAEDILKTAADVSGIKVIAANAGKMDMNGLRLLGDRLRDKFSGIIVLASENDAKANFTATASDEAAGRGAHCGEIVKAAAQTAGGSGGGRPNSAQAGGKDVSKIGEALQKTLEVIRGQLG